MLSYRHIFHAGNHADVLKHMTICLLMRYLNRKDKPYAVIDTHAGSGIYDLNDHFAVKNLEFAYGVSKVLEDPMLRRELPEYYACIDTINTPPQFRYYPGSACYEALLAHQDAHLFFIELHGGESQALMDNFGDNDNVSVYQDNGLGSLRALLPPIQRRALITIDPSYELRSDYDQVVSTLKMALGRFATGIYFIWYPVLCRERDQSYALVHRIRGLNRPLLQAELHITKQSRSGGMHGSGVLIINYPYGIEKDLQLITTQLRQLMALDDQARAQVTILVKAP